MMARIFVNVRGECDTFDTIGSEHGDLRSLHAHMISRAAAVALQSDRLFTQDDGWEVEALDERGRIVATLSFGLEKS